ncbi:MAG: cadmium-translocating P-type ATPase [Clostridiales bacterium]|nr:cadmium-translocating P-type ATPase [Clostridiales bacterium]
MERVFDITGMTCAACVAHVEKAVKSAGVENVNVNLLLNRMTVDSDVSDEEVIRAVESAGYGASVHGATAAAAKSGEKKADYAKTLFIRFIASLIFLIPLMYFSMGHMAGFPMGALDPHKNPASFALIQAVLTAPVLVINGRFFVSGTKAVLKRGANMDTLVSLGSGAAYIYGVVIVFLINSYVADGNMHDATELAMNLFFESAAMILTLVTLGKFLEAKSKGKTRSEVEKLLKLRPQTARVERDGQEIEIATADIRVGDTVIVLPGEYVPCDGEIIAGATTLDKSAITGESMPVEAVEGDVAPSAVLNLTGKVKLRATKVGADTTLSQIITMIENAGGSKAPIQKIADKVSAVFVPIVLGLALITLTVWLIIGTVGEALTMAISVLVISCPCALGLATPVAVMAGTGRAAAYGVLVKNAETLQGLCGVQIFALDKTATITEGKPRVTEVVAQNGYTKESVLKIASALEKTSTHPLATAIVEAYDGEAVEATTSEYRIGFGVVGTVDGVEYALGSPRLMKEFGVEVTDESDAQTVYLCKRGGLIGSIAVNDSVKPTSKAAIAALKKAGARVVMLTGDNERQANLIANEVGITEVYHDVLPEDKLSIIEELKTQGRVAMVGDGINDAPALKSADVGIAIGSGTDVAIDAADVVLVRSDLGDVPRAVAVSHSTLRNVKQNLFWACCYNALGIPLAAGVLSGVGVVLNPMIAAGAMALSSLFVVCNALRLTVMKFDDARVSRRIGKLGKSRAETKKTSETGEPATGEPAEIIENEGEDNMKQIIKVDGMSCMHCAARVETAISGIEGVKSVKVDLKKGEAAVKGEFDVAAAVEAVKAAGYSAIID